MKRETFTGADVDLSPLAQTLHDLADDIEEDGVLIEAVETDVEADAEEAVEFHLELDMMVDVGSRTLGNLAAHLEEQDERPEPIRP